jgi:cytochrome c oxidase subunit 4
MSEHSSGQSHHHILPLKTYLMVFSFLIVMTIVTVAVSLVHLGPFNIVVAMLVAAAKAIAVAAIFMHLKYDNKLYLLAFLISVLCLAVFIVLTLVDTDFRGRVDEMKAHPIVPQVVLPNAGVVTPVHELEKKPEGEPGTPAVMDSVVHHATPEEALTDTLKPAPVDSGH